MIATRIVCLIVTNQREVKRCPSKNTTKVWIASQADFPRSLCKRFMTWQEVRWARPIIGPLWWSQRKNEGNQRGQTVSIYSPEGQTVSIYRAKLSPPIALRAKASSSIAVRAKPSPPIAVRAKKSPSIGPNRLHLKPRGGLISSAFLSPSHPSDELRL